MSRWVLAASLLTHVPPLTHHDFPTLPGPSPFQDDSFWMSLAQIRYDLLPLALAVNITQSDHATLDTILHTLGSLHCTYRSRPASNSHDIILQSLEMRWKAADQEVFIMASILNPYNRGKEFAQACKPVGWLPLSAIIRRLHQRFFKSSDSDPSLRQLAASFRDYAQMEGDFASLPEYCEIHRDSQVSSNVSSIHLALLSIPPPKSLLLIHLPFPFRFTQGCDNPIAIWTLLRDDADHSELARLALRLLCIVGNSASCERAFSDAAIIKTKHRNRLRPATTLKMMKIRTAVRRQHQREKREAQRQHQLIPEPQEPEASRSGGRGGEPSSSGSVLLAGLGSDDDMQDGVGRAGGEEVEVDEVGLELPQPLTAARFERQLIELQEDAEAEMEELQTLSASRWKEVGLAEIFADNSRIEPILKDVVCQEELGTEEKELEEFWEAIMDTVEEPGEKRAGEYAGEVQLDQGMDGFAGSQSWREEVSQ